MKEPVGLTQHITAMIGMEDSVFCKSMSEAGSSDSRGKKSGRSQYNMGQSKPQNTGDRVFTRTGSGYPRQRYTDAELDAMRRDRICFKCKGPYSKTHECPNKELQV